MHFYPFLILCETAWWPHRVITMPFASIYPCPRTNSWKNWELGKLKISVFFNLPFWFFLQKKCNFNACEMHRFWNMNFFYVLFLNLPQNDQSQSSWQIPPQHQCTYLRGLESASIRSQIYLVKVLLNVNIVKQDLLHKEQLKLLKILRSKFWKGGFQLHSCYGGIGQEDFTFIHIGSGHTVFRFTVVIRWEKTQNEHLNIVLSKFEQSVIVNLMPI